MFSALIVLFVLLQMADALSTMFILHDKIGREANPAMQAVIEVAGLYGFALVKILLTAVCVWIFVYAPVPWFVIALICAAYSVIVYMNCRIIYDHARA